MGFLIFIFILLKKTKINFNYWLYYKKFLKIKNSMFFNRYYIKIIYIYNVEKTVPFLKF